MKSFSNHLIAALVIGALGLAGEAWACGGGGAGGGYNIGVGRGGGYNNSNYNRSNQTCTTNGGYDSNANGSTYGQAYEPFHSTYFVQPGDTFYEVSLKEYGTSAAANHISRFNRLAPNAALVPGQQLWLPSVSPNGQLTASRAPAADQRTFAQSNLTASTAKFTRPSTATTAESVTAVSEPERPSVPTGSTIKLDGEALGNEQGVVRLRVSNIALPVEVVEWSDSSTMVRLPKLDVNQATKAELEVVRADGSVAATNAIELTAAVSGLALSN